MSTRAFHKRASTVTVVQLKKYVYSLAVLMGFFSMAAELFFGSPTMSLSAPTATLDRLAFPIITVVASIIMWALWTNRLPVETFEGPLVGFAVLYFVGKFSLTLLTAKTLVSLAYIESWYWFMITIWTVSFLAYSFPRALAINLGVYTSVLLAAIVHGHLHTPSGELHAFLAEVVPSQLRLAGALTTLVLLGYVKDQWRAVEQEAITLRNVAHRDSLTGLPNRRRLTNILESLVRKPQSPVTVSLFDLDGFKEINDRFGHATGDAVLRHIAGLVQHCIRTDDTAGRWGGEEFLIICPDTEISEGRRLAERLRHLLAETPMHDGRSITASFGVAQLRRGESVAQLVARADAAMYAAKAGGKNQVST